MTGPHLLFLPDAEKDLAGIVNYIAQDNPVWAHSFVDDIREKCRFLAENPYAGRDRSELRAGLRSFPFQAYIIFYTPKDDGVVIVNVIHGRRDIPVLFETKE